MVANCIVFVNIYFSVYSFTGITNYKIITIPQPCVLSTNDAGRPSQRSRDRKYTKSVDRKWSVKLQCTANIIHYFCGSGGCFGLPLVKSYFE